MWNRIVDHVRWCQSLEAYVAGGLLVLVAVVFALEFAEPFVAPLYAQRAVVAPVLPGAQAPAAAEKKPAEAMTELETAWVQVVALAGQLADCHSRQLASVQQFTDVQADAQKRIEANHPGQTIDWRTGTLVPKATP